MSTVRQPCPQCQRTLELPLTAIGRMAKCPACDATFRVDDPNATPRPVKVSGEPVADEPNVQAPFVSDSVAASNATSTSRDPLLAAGAAGYTSPYAAAPNPYAPGVASEPKSAGRIRG